MYMEMLLRWLLKTEDVNTDYAQLTELAQDRSNSHK